MPKSILRQEVRFMSSPERPEQATAVSHSLDFSLSAFAHEVYGKGLIRAVEDRPLEAAVTTLGAVAVGAAVVYMSKGEALAGLLGRSGERTTVSAAVDRDLLADIRSAAPTGQVPGEKSLFSSYPSGVYKDVEYTHSVTGPAPEDLWRYPANPIYDAARAASSFHPVLRVPADMRTASIRGAAAYLASRPATMGPAIEELLTREMPISAEARAASNVNWGFGREQSPLQASDITSALKELEASQSNL
jgi:hypothetical protein